MLAFQDITGYVVVFTLVISACTGQDVDNISKQDCTGACKLKYRCNPYHNAPVWAIVDGSKCMIFKNGCILSNKNCQRKNNCLSPIIATDKNSCKQYCPTCTGAVMAAVCGIFSYVAPDGTNSDEHINFDNACELDKYACKKEKAYSYFNNRAC